MVRMPVMTHAINIQPALLIRRDMSAATIKIPEPIIEPTTIIVASSSPRPRTSFTEDEEEDSSGI